MSSTPGVLIDEVTAPRRIERAEELVAIGGRAPRGAVVGPTEVTSMPDFDEAFGTRDSGLRRAVSAYLAQEGDPLLVLRERSADRALGVLADTGVTLLALAPPLLRGHEAEVHRWCLDRRCFLLSHTADGSVPAGLGENAAVYTPGLRDQAGGRVWTSAAVAGVVRRNDVRRGVWDAPSGPEADVRGLVADPLVDGAVANPLRTFPGRPLLVWGARTAAPDPEWKYVNVRRLFLLIERSIDAGLQWTVFEPNAEPVWAQVRTAVSDFLYSLWRDGAFPAPTPDEAFFVRCDRSTMTQDDIDQGRLVVLVGAAPVQPAEFITLRFTLAARS